jgi:AAA+ superfamily predicted ATPase
MNKIFFLKLSFLCASTYAMANQEPSKNLLQSIPNGIMQLKETSENDIHKLLQNEALIQTDSLLRYLQQIGLRIEKLKLDSEFKKEITTTITNIREKLEKMKVKHTLYIDSVQLSRFITIVQALTQAIEKSLKQSFAIIPTIDPILIKRSQSQKATNPEKLKERLIENAKRLKKFDTLISVINLNKMQRFYRIASDAWNTPIYTFEIFGKADLYMSSVLKRIIVYPATFGCLLYGTRKKALEQVPFEPLKNIFLACKSYIGEAPHKESTTIGTTTVMVYSDNSLTPYETRTASTEIGQDSPDISGGIYSQLYNTISWGVEPGLEAKFSLGIGAYLTSFIQEDITNIKGNIPYIMKYIHNKLRGEHVEITISGQFETPKEIFDDVVGREGIKKGLQPIIDFIKNPLNYIQSGIKLPRGYILTGEPQTGKTLMVKALSGELTKQLKEIGNNKPMRVLTVNVPYIKKYGLNYCMEQAKKYAPCILFCDEFDLLQAQRDKDAVLLSDILEGLNGYHTSSDLKDFVIFMIATNRPEHIDFAVTENGRCGMTLYFENPNFYDRTSYFTSFFKKKLIDLDSLNINGLAEETEACSYGTLIEVANASLRAAESSSEIVQQKHVEIALNTIVRKIVTEGYDMPVEQKEVLATRYGSQAFASLALNPVCKLTGVTIYKITEKIREKDLSVNHYEALSDRSGHAGIRIGGLFSHNTQDTYDLVSQQELIKTIKIIVAGSVGQKVLGVDAITFPEDEIKALDIAQKIVFKGVSEKMYPKSVREEKKLEAYLLVQECKKEMAELLESKKEGLIKVTKLLQKRKLLRTSDITRCLGAPSIDLVEYFSNKPQEKEIKELIEETETTQ